MRLWHTDLIDVLPKKQICGQWNELGTIFNQSRGSNHALINFVYNYPKKELFNYSLLVIRMRGKLGYKYSLNNMAKYFETTPEDIISHINDNIPQLFCGKMTDRYLKQCLSNLQEKFDVGLISEDDWHVIYNKFYA